MSSYEIHGLKGLNHRLTDLQSFANTLQTSRSRLEGELARYQAEQERLAARQEILTKVLELYRVLMDKLVLNQVQALERIVSEGLGSIFYDQKLTFKFEMGSKYNKVSADPVICHGDIKGHPLDSFGGGPASIVSLILRILVLLRLKRYKALFLDETLAAVSDEYIEMTGQFLRKLSESSKLPLLLVTHKHSFLEHATSSYQGDKVDKPEMPPEFVVKKLRSHA